MNKFLIVIGVGLCTYFAFMHFFSQNFQTNNKSASKQFVAQIEGMVCEGCSSHLTKMFEQEGSIAKAEVDHIEGLAILHSDEELSSDSMKQLIEQNGYKLLTFKEK